MSSNSAELQNFLSPHANSQNFPHYLENSHANSINSSAKPENSHAYDDIIDMPYPFPPSVQKPRKRIALDVRAAEFAPFAALTGYHETIDEVSQTTGVPSELTVELFPEDYDSADDCDLSTPFNQ